MIPVKIYVKSIRYFDTCEHTRHRSADYNIHRFYKRNLVGEKIKKWYLKCHATYIKISIKGIYCYLISNENIKKERENV